MGTLSQQYYTDSAVFNLRQSSRTAKDGTINISSSTLFQKEQIQVCKENLDTKSVAQIIELVKNNKKSLCLDIQKLIKMSQQDIQNKVISNFKEQISLFYEYATEFQNDGTLQKDLRTLIQTLSKKVGQDIVTATLYQRNFDSNNFPYTKKDILPEEFEKFCEFLQKELYQLREISYSSQQCHILAAWIVYRFNLTDHYLSDSCGKVADILVAFVCMINNIRLPISISKRQLLQKAPKRRRQRQFLSYDQEIQEDRQFIKWKQFYLTLFLQNLEPIDISGKHPIDHQHEEGKFKKIQKNNGEQLKLITLDNLNEISKSVKIGEKQIAAAAVNGRQFIELNSPIFQSSFNLAKFSQLIDLILEDKDQLSLQQMLYKILNSVTQDPHKIFATQQNEFINFLKYVEDRIQRDCDQIETLALIHFDMILKHQYFTDFNQRISLALITYICIKQNWKLPNFQDCFEIEKFYGERGMIGDFNFKQPQLNQQFQDWLHYYRTLYNENREDIQNMECKFQDQWDVALQYKNQWHQNFSIIQESRIKQTDLMFMQKATNLQVIDIVVFKLERMLLHEIITTIFTTYQKPEKDDVVKKIFGEICQTGLSLDEIEKEFERDEQSLTKYLEYILGDYFPRQNIDPELQKKITYFKGHIQSSIGSKTSKQLLSTLVVDDLIRDKYQKRFQLLVKTFFQSNQTFELVQLQLYKNFQRKSWVIAGGPAAGKSSIFQQCIKFNTNYCLINPDLYKPYLVSQDNQDSDDRYLNVHDESSHIKKLIINRITKMIEQDLSPNLIFDIVKSKDVIDIATKGGCYLNLIVATCPVFDAVKRAFKRANNKTENNQDYKRFVPTSEVLQGHQQEPQNLPDTISNEQFLNFNLQIFDTKLQDPTLVAFVHSSSAQQLYIERPRTFVFEFVQKTKINEIAHFQQQVYTQQFSAKEIFAQLKKYLDKGIELFFMYSKEVQNLKSNRTTQQDQKEIKDIEIYQALNQKFEFMIQTSFPIFSCLSLQNGFIIYDIQAFDRLFIPQKIQHTSEQTIQEIDRKDIEDQLKDGDDEKQEPQPKPEQDLQATAPDQQHELKKKLGRLNKKKQQQLNNITQEILILAYNDQQKIQIYEFQDFLFQSDQKNQPKIFDERVKVLMPIFLKYVQDNEQ